MMKEITQMLKWTLPPLFIALWLYSAVELWHQGLSSDPNGVVIALILGIPMAILGGGAVLAVMILVGLLLGKTR